MFLLRAETIEQLRALCEIDPKHANGARSHRSPPWMSNQGSLALRVSFSDQRAQILQQPLTTRWGQARRLAITLLATCRNLCARASMPGSSGRLWAQPR
jgi:hypothetical protein